jgi:L-alanine-DL-glutamate epimerase-like enolase superfamily enzyme
MERAGVDVVQPSTVRSGGISEIMKIAEEAYRRRRLCIPHCWNHIVGVIVVLPIQNEVFTDFTCGIVAYIGVEVYGRMGNSTPCAPVIQ